MAATVSGALAGAALDAASGVVAEFEVVPSLSTCDVGSVVLRAAAGGVFSTVSEPDVDSDSAGADPEADGAGRSTTTGSRFKVVGICGSVESTRLPSVPVIVDGSDFVALESSEELDVDSEVLPLTPVFV
ncbi:hypothetical protein HGA11_21005 [Mycolicibacterium septicum DSM 44393]|uniref:Uncharacterized protein n=1 Tax=Mycolicibacterium septicum DSM 44393 TaxID=1341646 RepID=A0A7X6MSY5_9MYCO|nr:hypothetical protein [Mycolicibacterium septicum]NKZ13456.1 hypothetical protein [Mycolicibacterium septicum DSM 44393]